jgi:hypothetical protein
MGLREHQLETAKDPNTVNLQGLQDRKAFLAFSIIDFAFSSLLPYSYGLEGSRAGVVTWTTLKDPTDPDLNQSPTWMQSRFVGGPLDNQILCYESSQNLDRYALGMDGPQTIEISRTFENNKWNYTYTDSKGTFFGNVALNMISGFSKDIADLYDIEIDTSTGIVRFKSELIYS